MTNREKAREYFGLGVGDDDFVLHHKDPTLKKKDPKRYNEWRIEDLVVMTRNEHTSLHNKGKKLLEESKQKISEANKGKKQSEEHKHKRAEALKIPVCQYTLDGQLIKVWESATQAEKEGFNQSNVVKVCKGKYKHHKGYVWKYANK